jgi:FKBP-type peptidyl-prolyl cis-trans isomerase 2
MNLVTLGNKIKISLEGKFESGEIFYKKDNKDFLIEVGKKQIFPALEKELLGMKVGETKTITLEPKDAYGEYSEKFTMDIPKDRIDSDADISVGNIIVVSQTDGKKLKGVIIKDCDDTINVDFNHPFAGKKVIITFTIESIQKEDINVNNM